MRKDTITAGETADAEQTSGKPEKICFNLNKGQTSLFNLLIKPPQILFTLSRRTEGI